MLDADQNQHIQHHEAALFAEPVAHVGDFAITNSLLFSWFSVIILIVIFILAGKKTKKVPKGIQNAFEFVLETALKFADSITGSRKRTEKIFPIVFTLFLFILVNNWMGLLPGVGTVGFLENHDGKLSLVPLLRGGTADMNTTLAMSLFAIVFAHVGGVFTVGAWGHFNKFVNIKAILEIPQKFRHDKTIIFVNPIKIFVGLIEIVGEMAKVASLSLRLFGNIFAGEVLLASMMGIFAYLLPIPFIFMEIVVGMVQAMVFAILALAFMSIAEMEHH